MSASNKIIQAAAGGVEEEGPLDVQDVFSIDAFYGNGTSQTITNGINLADKGGLVWIKNRNGGITTLIDTERGATKSLQITSTPGTEATDSNIITAFNEDGFSIGNDTVVNNNNERIVTYTFRKAPKFFDIQTWTGTGSPKQISHNLGSVPGFIIVKNRTGANPWACYHRDLGATKYIELQNEQAAVVNSTYWNNTAPTDTHFTVGTTSRTNSLGSEYVAYIFAHNAGGFGDEDADESIIWCDKFVANTSKDIGFEPQFLLAKNPSGTSQKWEILDTVRSWNKTPTSVNKDEPYTPADNGSLSQDTDRGNPVVNGFLANWGTSAEYIGVAIRRDGVKTPTSGEQVFEAFEYSGSGTSTLNEVYIAKDSTLKNSDLFITGSTNTPYNKWMWGHRLRNNSAVSTHTIEAENEGTADPHGKGETFLTDHSYAYRYLESYMSYSGRQYILYKFKRANKFYDSVLYEGNGSNYATYYHSLNTTPELIIIKRLNASGQWVVAANGVTNNNNYIRLDSSDTVTNQVDFWYNSSAYKSDTFFRTGQDTDINGTGSVYIAHLFASVPGVCKIGTYEGNGTNGRVIDCGFENGARFVLIRNVDATSDWHVFDTERGIVAGNDSRMELNTQNAEETGSDLIDPDSSGFIVNSGELNPTSGTVFFMAIA